MTSNGHHPKPDRDPKSPFVPEAVRRMHEANAYERELAKQKRLRELQAERQREG